MDEGIRSFIACSKLLQSLIPCCYLSTGTLFMDLDPLKDLESPIRLICLVPVTFIDNIFQYFLTETRLWIVSSWRIRINKISMFFILWWLLQHTYVVTHMKPLLCKKPARVINRQLQLSYFLLEEKVKFQAFTQT